MAWNDGVSKALDDFINGVLNELGEAAIDSIKESVDKYSNEVFSDIRKTTPQATKEENSVDLVNHLTIRRNTEKGTSYYGYIIRYEGEYQNGTKLVPYQKLANILNYGAVRYQIKKDGSYGSEYQNVIPTRYISKAIRKLRELDPEINERFEKKEKELMKNG